VVTESRCRIIASIDANHNGDVDAARRLIDAAREAGADGVKLQKRSVNLAAVRQMLDRPAPRYVGLAPTYRKALERVDLPIDVLARLCEHAAGLDILLAPGDVAAWREIVALPFSAVKIDPALIGHQALLEAVAGAGRPVVASVIGVIRAELDALLRLFPRDLTLMHTLNRHAATVVGVSYLTALRRFGRPVGHADTTLDATPSLTAVALGAVMIEKPLTLDRAQPGPDHAASFTPAELAELVRGARAIEEAAASDRLLDPTPDEMDQLEWERPSIVAARSIPRGAIITADMLTLKPPAWGLSPRALPMLEGRRARYDIAEDDFLTFGVVDL
jgi:N,N'-diacetyllegionaminate synthase